MRARWSREPTGLAPSRPRLPFLPSVLASAAGACALLTATSAFAAAQREAHLRYTRGAGADHCPDEATLRGAIQAKLGYDPFRADASRVIDASIARTGRALRAEIKLIDASGNVTGARELVSTHNDCSELVGAMTLAISIAIDPQSELRPAPPSPSEEPPSAPSGPPATSPPPSEPPATSPPPSEPPATSPPPPAGPPAALPPPPRRTAPTRPPAPERTNSTEHYLQFDRVVFHVGVATFMSLQSAPSIALGFSASVGLRKGSASVGLEGRGDIPASADISGGGVVSSTVLLATLTPCYHRQDLVFCLLVSGGAMRGTGTLIDVSKIDVTPFASVGLRVGVELFRAAPFSGRLYVDAAAPLTPTTLELAGRDAWQTPRVAFAMGIAGLAHFF